MIIQIRNLQSWADRIKKLNPAEIFIYFNNDYDGYGIFNGKIFEKMLIPYA